MSDFIKIFENEKEVLAAFSLRSAGDLKNNPENQRKFFNQFNIDLDKIVFMNQVHSINIEQVDGSKNLIEKIDGIFTDKKEVFLAVNTADCLPIFIYSLNPKIVGIIHGGWRCLTSGILQNFFKKLDEQFNLDYDQVKVVIGPGIQRCHFEIKKDVLNEFNKYSQFIIKKDNKMYVDLPAITKKILTKLGLSMYNIKSEKDCTFCQAKKYYSFRREKKGLEGEMLGFIGLI